MTQTKQNYFLSQPHQPFFILGIVNAIVMMLIFALGYKGILNLEIQNLSFHVYSISFLVFLNVFIGFLFTTFGRFSQSGVTISPKYYTNIFYTNTLASILFLSGAFFSHTVLVTGMFVSLVSQIFIILKLQNIYKEGWHTIKVIHFGYLFQTILVYLATPFLYLVNYLLAVF